MPIAEFEATLSAARQGDQTALRVLFEAYAGRLRGFLRSIGCRELDDFVSETFLRAFRSLETFQGTEDAFRGWLFTIARNLTIDEARKAARRIEAVPLDERIARATAASTSLEESALGIEFGAVPQLLEVLTEDQRNVLLLRIVAGLSVDETAKSLGKTKGSVKLLQHRALCRLQAIIESSPNAADLIVYGDDE